ncbi:MAG: hypothetical protein MJK18_09280, partial [Bdellovibrionales bacterium]|nr:hypothetical protein [Bdellovibrionales bacterium]
MRYLYIFISLHFLHNTAVAQESCDFLEEKISSRMQSFQEQIRQRRAANLHNMRIRHPSAESVAIEASQAEEVRIMTPCNVLEYKKLFLADFKASCDFESSQQACQYDTDVEWTVTRYIRRARSVILSLTQLQPPQQGARQAISSLIQTLESTHGELANVHRDMSTYVRVISDQSRQCQSIIEQGILNEDCVTSLDNVGHVDVDVMIADSMSRFCFEEQVDRLMATVKATMNRQAVKVCEAVNKEESRVAQRRRLENSKSRVAETVNRVKAQICQLRQVEVRLVAG